MIRFLVAHWKVIALIGVVCFVVVGAVWEDFRSEVDYLGNCEDDPL